VQTHSQSFILLIGKEVDFGAEELSNQGTGVVEAFDLGARAFPESHKRSIATSLPRWKVNIPAVPTREAHSGTKRSSDYLRHKTTSLSCFVSR
jgi:hypothetical protein